MKAANWQPEGQYVLEFGNDFVIIGRFAADANGRRGVFARVHKKYWDKVKHLIELTNVIHFWQIEHYLHKNILETIFDMPGKFVVVISGCTDVGFRDAATDQELLYLENVSTLGTAILASASTFATMQTLFPEQYKPLKGTAKKIMEFTHLLAVAFGTNLNHPWFCKPAYFDDAIPGINILEVIAAQAAVYSRVSKITLEVLEKNNAIYVENLKIAGTKISVVERMPSGFYKTIPGITPYNLEIDQRTPDHQIKYMIWKNPAAQFVQRIFIDTSKNVVFEYAPRNNLRRVKRLLYKTHPFEVVMFADDLELYGADLLTDTYLAATRRSLPMNHYLPGGGHYTPPNIIFLKNELGTYHPILITYQPEIDKRYGKEGVTIKEAQLVDNFTFTKGTLEALRWRLNLDKPTQDLYTQLFTEISNISNKEIQLIL